jgi:hypothetical protein
MEGFDYGLPFISVTLESDDEPYPPLRDVAKFLSGFNMLYEAGRIAFDPNYPSTRNPLTTFPDFWLTPQERLRVMYIRQESPLLIVTVAAATSATVAAFWGVVQTVEKIANWKINRDILKLQRDKLRQELIPDENDDRIANDLDSRLKFFNLIPYRKSAENELVESRVTVTRFDVEFISRLPKKNKNFPKV